MNQLLEIFDDAAASPPKKWGRIPKREHNIPKEDGREFLAAAKAGNIAEVTQWLDKYGKDILEVKERDWGVYNNTDRVTGEDHSFTALMLAVNGSHRDLVTLLLDRGADINARFDFGQTVLMLGLDENDNLAEMLLDRGADITAYNDRGETALMWPQTEDSIRFLLSRGADVHVRNTDGETALMLVAAQTYLHRANRVPSSVLDALLDGGLDIDARDNKGNTALMIAAARSVYDDDTPDKLTCLIRRGANPLVRNNDNDTAAILALRLRPDLDGDKPRQKQMGELLEKAAADWQAKQVDVCMTGSADKIAVTRPLQYRKPVI